MGDHRMVRGGVALVMVGLLVGCGGAAPSGSGTPPGQQSPGEQSAQPPAQAGGTLRVAVETDLRDSDNLQARTTNDRIVVGSTVYEPLFGSDENGEPRPALATEAIPSEDNRVWNIKLQAGVTFHNGKPFTADDVKANFDAYLDPANASNLAGDIGSVASVEVVTPTEVKVTLTDPQAAFPGVLTDTVFMADMDAREEMGDGWAEQPIGTGPYKWFSRTIGDNITFVRYDDYWRGRPPLDRVVFQVIPDAQVAVLGLERGEIDLIPNYVSIAALPGLRANESFQILSIPTNTWFLAFPNFEKARNGGYVDAAAFRLGLAHLFNAEEQVPQIIGDFGTYGNQMIPPWQRGHDPDLDAYPYDPVKGVELLTQAGYPPGSTIKILVGDAPHICDWATAVQSTVRQLGYTVTLQCASSEVVAVEVLKYDWDLMFTRNSGRVTAGGFFNDRWRKSLAEAKDDYYTLQSDELQAVIDELTAETDPVRAEELAQQATNIIIKDQVAVIGGYWQTAHWAASAKVQGLKLSPLAWNGFLWNNMSTVSLSP